MPIYEFKACNNGCQYCSSGFELLLKLDDQHPTQCPKCEQPVAQAISAPFVHAGTAHVMSEGNIEKSGFTQYRKAGGGVYEKTAGKGPDFIADDGK